LISFNFCSHRAREAGNPAGGQKGRGLGGRNFCPPSLSPLPFCPPDLNARKKRARRWLEEKKERKKVLRLAHRAHRAQQNELPIIIDIFM